jgi:hypothetical protein
MQGLVPIFGMITGLITTGLFFWGIVKLAQGPVGTALARRIQGHSAGAEIEAEFAAELSHLRDQVDGLRTELTETQERLDFAERMLAKGRTPERLPGN